MNWRIGPLMALLLPLLVSGRLEARAKEPRNPEHARVTRGIRTEVEALRAEFRKTRTLGEQKVVLDRARMLLLDTAVNRLAPLWYGTPWAFHGYSAVPRDGQVSCGAFVTAVLADAGMEIDRWEMSVIPSERTIRSLVSEPNIKRFSQVPAAKFVETVRTWGAGLYVLGLDFHIGLIFHDGTDVWFIHSSYVEPHLKVVKEPALISKPIVNARYRVLGKLTADDGLLRRWLGGAYLPVVN